MFVRGGIERVLREVGVGVERVLVHGDLSERIGIPGWFVR